jgi:hypothetical protein
MLQLKQHMIEEIKLRIQQINNKTKNQNGDKQPGKQEHH